MATFCTVQNIRDRNFEIDVTKHAELSDLWLNQIISDMSDWVQGMLFNTQGAIVDVPATPVPIQLLTIYACMEQAIMRMYSQFRTGDSTDIVYWQERKDEQLEGLLSHRITADGMAMPAFGTNKEDLLWKPAFGYGKYGQRITRVDLPDEETEYETREDT